MMYLTSGRHIQWHQFQPLLDAISCIICGHCKGTTHFRHSAHATPEVAAQLRLRACNSGCGCATPNSGNSTLIMFMDPFPCHQPRYPHSAYLLYSPFSRLLAYIVVVPSRVFLRVFSLDFPLLGQYFTFPCIIVIYIYLWISPCQLSDFLSTTGLPLQVACLKSNT